MRPQKITFGDMREMGVRGVLVYCADDHCGHSVALSADHCRPRDGISKCDVKGSGPSVGQCWGPV